MDLDTHLHWAGVAARSILAVLACALTPAAAADVNAATSKLDMGLDISFLKTNGHPSWLEGSAGKLRYDESTDGLEFSRGFIDYEALLTDTVKAHVVSELYNDNFGPALDFTEAYLEWRPVPVSANRYRVKLGAFYHDFQAEDSSEDFGTELANARVQYADRRKGLRSPAASSIAAFASAVGC